MPRENLKQKGAAGELAARSFLLTQGYRIVALNVRPLPGLARGEIDIIAWDGSLLCFVEVKTRRAGALPPALGVTIVKRRRIAMLAEAYLSAAKDAERAMGYRFDVVSVWIDPSLPEPILTLHKDAFRAEE